MCLLLYGDNPARARRILERWKRPWIDRTRMRFGLNASCIRDETLADLTQPARPFVHRENTNIGKPAMMRRLLHEPPIDTEWTLWFDDDSFPFRADWLASLNVAITAQPEAVMLGIPAVTHVGARMVDFISEAPWYRGLPPQPSGQREMAARIDFILGGFWAIRTEWLARLDWPDRRIVHFEDDYLLGEAIRQNGGKLGRFHSGVKVDTEPRRAPASMPATLDVWRSQSQGE